VRCLCHSTTFSLVFVCRLHCTRKNQSDRIFNADKYITWSLSITTVIIIHRQRNGSNKQNAYRVGVRKQLCYCSLLDCSDSGTTSRCISGATQHAPPTLLVSNGWNISHRQGNQILTSISYSGSFKVMHLGITEKLTRGCISCLYIVDILSKVTEQTATENDNNCYRRLPHCFFWRPEEPHIPYISGN